MPLRSVKMNRFIFGFQRRVWCPKWTPLSSRFFMLTTATWRRLPSRARAARGRDRALPVDAGHRVVRRPGVRPRHPPVRRRDRGGDCPAVAAGRRTREVGPPGGGPHRAAYALPVVPRTGRPQGWARSTTARSELRAHSGRSTVWRVTARHLLAVLAAVVAAVVAVLGG